MRTIAISDIHGCYKELKELLEKVEYNKDKDKLIFLGDYIDRGADSRKVIELVRSLQAESNNVIALMGNHEDMLLDYYERGRTDWKYNGYSSTIRSYNGFEEQFKNDITWMENLPLYYEDENFIYVHAGVDMSKPLKEQNRYTLLWTREEFIYDENEYYKRVIFGHTPTTYLGVKNKPTMTYSKNIDIDTGCVFGGALSALIIEDGEVKGFAQVEKK